MSLEKELSPGDHSVMWTWGGYSPLYSMINVSDVGAVSCLPVVGGGICGSTIPPGVVVAGTFVTGYLAEAALICPWIDESGVGNLTLNHAVYVFFVSKGAAWTDLADSVYATLVPQPSEISTIIATLDNAVGVLFYSKGTLWYALGNSATGCDYS